VGRLERDLGLTSSRRGALPHGEIPRVRHRHRHEGGDDRRRHVESIVEQIRGETRTPSGVERERVADLRASKLEQIAQLRLLLEEEGLDCSNVVMPRDDAALEEVDSVLNILRLKNDRNRCSTLAEEVIMGGAELVETVLDGSHEIPLVGWRPDYTGYSSTVAVKVHRMRFETSQLVGNIVQQMNVGPTWRIIMELLPGFLLYPKQQRKMRGRPGLSSDPQIVDARSAYASINDSERRRGGAIRESLQDLGNI
jgi:hypothetical protein